VGDDDSRSVGGTEAVGVKVRDLILATRHCAPPASPDAALIIDIDLSVFGQAPAVFDAYEAGIRTRVRMGTGDDLRGGSFTILAGFLDRRGSTSPSGLKARTVIGPG
jgi:predicted metal-dependent HD superfamily phosphohydrolase